MTSDTIKEESKLTYDDRRKILNQKKSQVVEHKEAEVKDADGKIIEKEKLISTVTQSMEVNYTEDGIKLAHLNLSKEKAFLEEKSKELKEKFDKVEEMPEDLKDFKKKLSEMVKYDEAEKARGEHSAIQERLEDTNKELKGLNDEIGDRLKF